MPFIDGSKTENVTAKVSEGHKRLMEDICVKEDRSMSYVVGQLALRGLAQYMRDGKLKLTEDEEKVFDKRNKLEPLEMIQVERGGKVNEDRTKRKKAA